MVKKKKWKTLMACMLAFSVAFGNGAPVVHAEEVPTEEVQTETETETEKKISDVQEKETEESGEPAEETEKKETAKVSETEPEAGDIEEKMEAAKLQEEKKAAQEEQKAALKEKEKQQKALEVMSGEENYYYLSCEKNTFDMLTNSSLVLDGFSVSDMYGEEVKDYELIIPEEEIISGSDATVQVRNDNKSIVVTSGTEEGYINFKVVVKVGEKEYESLWFYVDISDEYYELTAPKAENIDVGEILDLSTLDWTLTRHYKENGQEKAETVSPEDKGITLKVGEPDEEGNWKIADGNTNSNLPKIVRTSVRSFGIDVTAYDESEMWFAYSYMKFESIDYGLEVVDESGERLEYVYTDEPCNVQIRKNEYGRPLPEGLELEYAWEISGDEELAGGKVSCDTSKDVGTNQISCELDKNDSDNYYVYVNVTITTKEEEYIIAEIEQGFNVLNPYFSIYDSIFDGSMFLGVDRYLSTIDGGLLNGRYPNGEDIRVNVTKITSDKPDVITVKEADGEWIVSPVSVGEATLTIETDAEVTIGKVITETVTVSAEKCQVYLNVVDSYNIVAGKTKDVTVDVEWKKYVEGSFVEKGIDDLIFEWSVKKEGDWDDERGEWTLEDTSNVTCEQDSKNPSVLHIRTNAKAAEEYIYIGVKAYEKLENGGRGDLKVNDEYLVGFYVSRYEFTANTLYVHPGDTVSVSDFKPQLKENGVVVIPYKVEVYGAWSEGEWSEEEAWVRKSDGLFEVKSSALDGGTEKQRTVRIGLEAWKKGAEGEEKEYMSDCYGKLIIHNPSWSAWKTTQAATVNAPEQQSRECTVCHKKETRTVGNKLTPYVNLTANSLKMKTKQTTKAFKVTGMAAGDRVKSVVSSNKKVLKVSGVSAAGTFKLSAQKKKGTAKLTITTVAGAKKTIKVTVQTKAVKTTKISGLSKMVTIKKGKSVKLKPVIAPVTSQDKVTYKTSNKKIATVSSKGVIKGKKAGKAKITVKSGSKKYTVTVVVTK